ncbi:MAG TPA: hypothetical protein PLB91_03385 [Spirochaetales bacterium]|nr:hypothetical protein [Spirochaetales bacterium]HRY55397.1 hypothetical protein [Spirochaetia bacterium]
MHKKLSTAPLILVMGALAFAQQPKALKEIPLYPGAARDQAAMDEEREAYGGEGHPGELSRESVIYRSAASVEEVFAWYRQKLGAVPRDYDSEAAERPALVKPDYELRPYTEEDFRDGEAPDSGKKTYDGAWIREQLKARRKPVQGQWLSGAFLAWGHADKQGRGYDFQVSIEDRTFDAYQGFVDLPGGVSGLGKKDYRQSTSIRIEQVVYKAEGELRDERDAADDELAAGRAAELRSAPPTAKELGVPLYPGAILNVDASAGMSMDEGSLAYVYLSADAPAKLVAFYEKATGRKAEALDGGAFRIVLKGKGLFPEHYLSIEPNKMFGGGAKTVLSVFRAEP